MADKIEVLLALCKGYEKQELKEQFDLFASLLSFPQSFRGDSILLKPNLISGFGPSLGCTNGIFLATLAEWFIDRGAIVSVGDSPAFGSAAQVLARQSILPLLKPLAVNIVEFRNPRTRCLSNDVTVGIAQEALDCDFFINVPKVKAHNQMFMTMAVKNLFGTIVGMRKALAHMKNGSSHLKFAELMLDLVGELPNQVTICDGIETMHRQGPVNGESRLVGCLSARADPVALDTALLGALELDHQRCPIWRAAERRRIAGSSPGAIGYPLLSPQTFHGSGFVPPEELSPVPFNPFRFLTGSLRKVLSRLHA
jgi:uncharacterized protein (DUF362 family)